MILIGTKYALDKLIYQNFNYQKLFKIGCIYLKLY